jgi:hypothetical protein
MQKRIDAANALSVQRVVVACKIGWQDYADVLWAVIEVRQTKGPEGRFRGLRLKKLAECIREALDRAGVEKPRGLVLPPKI